MILWSQVAPALVRLISRLALAPETRDGLAADFEAQWAEKQRTFTHPQVGVDLLLRIVTVAPIGTDERRICEEETTDEPILREHIVGQRRITLEIRVDAIDHDEEADEWCWSMIERIRTGLRFHDANDELARVNVALIDTEAASDVTFDYDGHRHNAAIMNVLLAGGFDSRNPVPLNWIERVHLTAKAQGVDGQLLPSPPNYTNHVVEVVDDSEEH